MNRRERKYHDRKKNLKKNKGLEYFITHSGNFPVQQETTAWNMDDLNEIIEQIKAAPPAKWYYDCKTGIIHEIK